MWNIFTHTSPTPSSQCHVFAAITTPKQVRPAFQDHRITSNTGKSDPPQHFELVTSETMISEKCNERKSKGEG